MASLSPCLPAGRLALPHQRGRGCLYNYGLISKHELLNIETASFVVLDDKSAGEAAEFAARTGVKGMDALVIQVSKEFGTELISFDEEMILKSEKQKV